jgi:hypothetical protein
MRRVKLGWLGYKGLRQNGNQSTMLSMRHIKN